MTGELRFAEVTTVKDGLLDAQVAHNHDSINGALQSQWEVIRDGMTQGAGAKMAQAKDNSLLTGVEMAGSFGLGAGLTWALKAGGRYTAAAEAGAAIFTGLMAFDLGRRGTAIHEAYANSNGDTLQGQAMRKDAIAQYAGSGLVDYSLMFASGGLGSASVHFGPKMAASLSTALEPLGKFGTLEAATLQPVRASNFQIMNLGETGRLGARELPAVNDPIAAARNHLDFPHRSVGLDQLSALMEAKQLAAHPEVKPVFEQMADTLSKVDTLKPQLAKDEQALTQLNKELADAKSLKPELQAVRAAETSISSLRSEMEQIPALREEQSRLTRQIQESKGAKDNTADPRKAAAKEPQAGSEELRTKRREITDSISSIQSRAQDLPSLQQRLSQANENFSKRKAAIEAGDDPQVKELESQMQPLQASVDAGKTQLASLTEALKNLNQKYQSTSEAVRPTLKDAELLPASAVPKYTRPKIEEAARPASKKAEAKNDPPPLTIEQPVKPALKTDAGAAKSPLETRPAPEPTKVVAEKTTAGARDRSAQSERLPLTERPTTEADVNRAASEARQSVDDFSSTHRRHTTALKKVNDYIEKAFSWFSGDQAAAANAPKVAANVDSLLAKLENWDRAPGWIRSADKAQTMQRNGFDAATMDKFDKWYQTQNKNFSDSGNMSPDRKLLEIQEHLSRRVAVESVKNWLRMAPDVDAAVSPIVQQGFQIMADGKLPDGRAIPKGSDMIVFEKLKGPNDQEMVLPFAKDGQHVQRFDDSKIVEGLRKLDAMSTGGPQALSAEDLYGFRLDHDPSRLLAAGNQVGFAILRPGGQYGKNVMFMQFADSVDPALIPRSLRVDGPNGPGTNTGVLYNMVKNAGRNGSKTGNPAK